MAAFFALNPKTPTFFALCVTMEEESHTEEVEIQNKLEVAPALISVHPSQKSLAVAVGSDLRVFNLM